jgi:hypothetical protein
VHADLENPLPNNRKEDSAMDTKTTKPDPLELIVAALRACGDLTAAAIGDKIGMAYSTVTPKLRKLEDDGRAERLKDNGRTLWRLTTSAQAPADSGDAEDVPDGDPATAPPLVPADALPETTDAATCGYGDPADTDPSGTTAPDDDADNADASADPPAPESAPQPAAANDQANGDSAPTPQPAATAPATPPEGDRIRRPSGALDRTAMRVVQANPDTEYKVTDLARLIDKADDADGRNYKIASPGAVVLACERLVDRGHMTKVKERPATFKFAKALPANP